MSEPLSSFDHYRAQLLRSAHALAAGVSFQQDLATAGVDAADSPAAGRETANSSLLAWSDVDRVLCADVGEPEGVRTIVFDLVVGVGDGAPLIYRFDADPGEDAMAAAQTAERGIPRVATSTSLREVAKDGVTHRWFPDLESFEEANLASLRGDRTLD